MGSETPKYRVTGQEIGPGISYPRYYVALILAVWITAVVVLSVRLHYGFLPEDDPAVAYLGDRTLAGELPNVDFYDNYTGGLSYLNAAALRLFGTRLISLRIMLLVFFVLWIPAVWYLASKITSRWNALLLTSIAAVWSVPVYPAPYATWYNLYFATFGTAALFRYLETRGRQWIFWAGVCGGLSFLAKIFGLYFVAACCLLLLFDEQSEAAQLEACRKTVWFVFPTLVTVILLLVTGAFAAMVNSAIHSRGISAFLASYYHFVLPMAAVAVFLIHREWSIPRISPHNRLRGLAKRLGILSLGFVIPIAIFLVPYIRRGVVSQWFSNVLLSRERVQHAANPPASNVFILLCVPLLLIFLLNAECKESRTRKVVFGILSVLLGLLLLAGSRHLLVSGLVWFSIAESLPLLVIIAAIVLYRNGLSGGRPAQHLALLAFVTAMLGLVEFPFAAPIYFFFVAPILYALLVALGKSTQAIPRSNSLFVPVIVFYLLFGLIAILPSQFYVSRFDKTPEMAFTTPRAAGFIGDSDTVELYQKVVSEVLRHAGDAPIYAGPDSPGLYFLTGHRNPTRIYMDFLAGDDAKPERILNAIDSNGVRAVVINHGEFRWGPSSYNPSGPPSPRLLDGLRARFPLSSAIGFFEIRWKDDPPFQRVPAQRN